MSPEKSSGKLMKLNEEAEEIIAAEMQYTLLLPV